MKNLFLSTVIISFLLLISCRENAGLKDEVVNPALGGVYTETGGTLKGRLKFSDEPFLVTSDIKVDSSDTLIIEPGVNIFFKESRRMIVNGVLIAAGTRQKPIVFTSFLSDWLGISIIDSPDTSVFKFCVVRDVFQRSGDPAKNGAVEVNNSSAVFENCIFISNTARYGGGIAVINSSATIKNNIFRDNDTDIYGGALYALNSSTQLINNTVFRNICFNFGGGFVFDEPVNADVQNNIFYKNFSFLGDPRIAFRNGDSTLVNQQYNFLAFGSMDPLFISSDDLHLSDDSPCIDAGNPDPAFNDVDGTRNDQGAYGGPLGDW